MASFSRLLQHLLNEVADCDVVILPDFSSEDIASLLNLVYSGRYFQFTYVTLIINICLRSSAGTYICTHNLKLLTQIVQASSLQIRQEYVFDQVHGGGDSVQVPTNSSCNKVFLVINVLNYIFQLYFQESSTSTVEVDKPQYHCSSCDKTFTVNLFALSIILNDLKKKKPEL